MEIIYNDSLPFQEYFKVIEEYDQLGRKEKELLVTLERKTEQFRVIEKRLIQKFRESNSKGLDTMDAIFKQTYKEVIGLSKEIEEYQTMGRESWGLLLVVNHLMTLLVALRFQLSSPTLHLLHHLLLPAAHPPPAQQHFWSNQVYSHILYLLNPDD